MRLNHKRLFIAFSLLLVISLFSLLLFDGDSSQSSPPVVSDVSDLEVSHNKEVRAVPVDLVTTVPIDPELAAFFRFMERATPEEQAVFYIHVLFGPRLGPRFEKMIRTCENPPRRLSSGHLLPALYVRAVSRTGDYGVSQINKRSWYRRFTQVTGQPWDPGIYDPYWNVYFAKWLNDQTSGRGRPPFNQWTCQYAS